MKLDLLLPARFGLLAVVPAATATAKAHNTDHLTAGTPINAPSRSPSSWASCGDKRFPEAFPKKPSAKGKEKVVPGRPEQARGTAARPVAVAVQGARCTAGRIEEAGGFVDRGCKPLAQEERGKNRERKKKRMQFKAKRATRRGDDKANFDAATNLTCVEAPTTSQDSRKTTNGLPSWTRGFLNENFITILIDGEANPNYIREDLVP
ncbi:hypothetical protein DFJ73DRAFT_945643 [Zopfochytrium polystomum]|nr:hypothetical protein DFJ73DRAFT_945643 [Zopfochytrium polystomum]